MKTIILCAGQSNMVGRRNKIKKQDPKWWNMPKGVQLFHKRKLYSKWKTNYYGPELGFAHKITEKHPDWEIIILKVAQGGTNLYYDWNPNGASRGEEINYKGPLYPKLINQYKRLEKLLNSKKILYTVGALLWMQGESDGSIEKMAKEYKKNFEIFINSVRKDTKKKDLPIIIGRVKPGKTQDDNGNSIEEWSTFVRKAQSELSKEIKYVRTVDLDDLSLLQDGVHYSDESMLEMGIRFANNVAYLL